MSINLKQKTNRGMLLQTNNSVFFNKVSIYSGLYSLFAFICHFIVCHKLKAAEDNSSAAHKLKYNKFSLT